MFKKLIISFVLLLFFWLPSHAVVTYISMDALTDGSPTVADTWYIVGYTGATPYRWTIASLFGLKFGTMTDTKYCTYSSSTGKISCTASAGVDATGIFEIPAAAPTLDRQLNTTGTDGKVAWLSTPDGCYVGGTTGGAATCKTLASLYADVQTSLIYGTPSEGQMWCARETSTGSGVWQLYTCGEKTTYTEPAGNVSICRTGTGAVGSCSVSSTGTFSSIEVGHVSDTTLSRASAGVVAVEGLSLPRIVASGSTALDFGSTLTGACATVIQAAATGTASTDVIIFTPNLSIKAVTGYVPASTGGFSITAFPSAGYVNFEACNWTAGTVDPNSITVNWMVLR